MHWQAPNVFVERSNSVPSFHSFKLEHYSPFTKMKYRCIMSPTDFLFLLLPWLLLDVAIVVSKIHVINSILSVVNHSCSRSFPPHTSPAAQVFKAPVIPQQETLSPERRRMAAPFHSTGNEESGRMGIAQVPMGVVAHPNWSLRHSEYFRIVHGRFVGSFNLIHFDSMSQLLFVENATDQTAEAFFVTRLPQVPSLPHP